MDDDKKTQDSWFRHKGNNSITESTSQSASTSALVPEPQCRERAVDGQMILVYLVGCFLEEPRAKCPALLSKQQQLQQDAIKPVPLTWGVSRSQGTITLMYLVAY